MKRLIRTALTLVLSLGLATTAFAAEEGITVNGEDIVININGYDNDEFIITCKGTVTENVTVVREGSAGNAEYYEFYYTQIALKPGSELSVKTADGSEREYGFCYYWDNENNAYREYPVGGLNSGLADELFGEVDIEMLGEERVDAYILGNYFITLGSESQSTSATTTPDSYTAVKYDTWGQIALNNYGSYGAWQQLYKANNYAKLTEGTVITLPETLGKYTRIGAPVATEGETLYTVKAGDTLGTIAKAVYGDAAQYKAIFERNADRLKNANTIYEGQIIVLPAK